MKPKLTPWFPVRSKPAHVGEYDYKYRHGYEFRAFWNGTAWIIHDANDEYWWGREVVSAAGHKWRGLTEDPAKAK